MAADGWSKQKVIRTARGQEGGSGRGQTEDVPEQQAFKATGNPMATHTDQRYQLQGQAAPLQYSLQWVPKTHLGWRCVLAQTFSLTCCPAVPYHTWNFRAQTAHFTRKPSLAALQHQPSHSPRAAVPQGSASKGCVCTNRSAEQLGSHWKFLTVWIGFAFSLWFLSSCKNTVKLVWQSTTLHP